MMRNLDYFISAVKEDRCTENMVLDLMTEKLEPFVLFRTASSLKRLSDAIASGKCKPGLVVNLQFNKCGNGGVKALANCLRSENRPENITFQLKWNMLYNQSVQYIMDALVQGPKTRGVTINIQGGGDDDDMGCGCTPQDNHLNDKAAIIFARGLETMFRQGNCPLGLSINFSGTRITNAGANVILEVLEAELKSNSQHQISIALPGGVEPDLCSRVSGACQALLNKEATVEMLVFRPH